jgi:serine/threonine protein kinase
MQDIKMYMRTLVAALSFVHENNVIHRDVKPSNFLYDASTQQGVLADFGLAQVNKPLSFHSANVPLMSVKSSLTKIVMVPNSNPPEKRIFGKLKERMASLCLWLS